MLAVALVLGGAGSVNADVMTFYGLDRAVGPGGAHPGSDVARVAFLSQLDPASVGVEDFEDDPVGSFFRGSQAIAFAGTSVTGTIVSLASAADQIRDTPTSTSFAISGSRYYYSQDRVGGEPFFRLTFNTPQTAIGFYGTSFSDYLGATIVREPIRLSIDGGTPIDTLNVDPKTIPGGSVSFFGLISDVPFTTVTLINTPFPSADEIGVDDIVIGARAPAVPEPSSLVATALGLAVLAGLAAWRRYRSCGPSRVPSAGWNAWTRGRICIDSRR